MKCGFDVAGLVGFASAVGVFLTAGTLECPAAEATGGEDLQMGCAVDVSAVFAALTTVAGFIGILATECPEDPDKPATPLGRRLLLVKVWALLMLFK